MSEIDRMSQWLDDKIGARIRGDDRDQIDAELLLMHRTVKVVEEIGESVAAIIGYLGANPRKGATSTSADVVEELLDVAIAALGAVEHMTENTGRAEELLQLKIAKVVARAGLGERASS